MFKNKLTFFLIFCIFNFSYAVENLVEDKYPLTNIPSSFCNHTYLPFPCHNNQFVHTELLPNFFSLVGNSFAIQLVSSIDNFASSSRGIFSIGNAIANPLIREELVSLGNFYNRGPDWVKSGDFFVWNNGIKIFTSKVEFQINGQDSRSAPQKAIRLKLSSPLSLSNYAPRIGLKRLTLYPIYRSLGGAKILHYIINETFRKHEIWFEKWQITPLIINKEFWGTYFLARPDLEIQEDFFGTSEGIEGTDFDDFLSRNKKIKFNDEALLKFLAFQSVLGNNDIAHNFRSFVYNSSAKHEIQFTYTDLDEMFNLDIKTKQVALEMGNNKIFEIYITNIDKIKKYEKYWKNILRSNSPARIYDQFNSENFMYLLFNNLRWGSPYNTDEHLRIKTQLDNYEFFLRNQHAK